MLYQYNCACCNKVVASTDKECPYCGSQHIRSPYGWWIFCIVGCFAVVMIFKSVQFYIQTHETDTPEQKSILDVLNSNDKKTN